MVLEFEDSIICNRLYVPQQSPEQREREVALAGRQGIAQFPPRPQARHQNGVIPHETQ